MTWNVSRVEKNFYWLIILWIITNYNNNTLSSVIFGIWGRICRLFDKYLYVIYTGRMPFLTLQPVNTCHWLLVLVLICMPPPLYGGVKALFYKKEKCLQRIGAGFLQVRENWTKSGNLSGQGKVKGKYFFWKSQGKWKIGATRCQIFRIKCIRFDFRWGSAPDTFGGAYSIPPDLLAALSSAPWMISFIVLVNLRI